MAFSKLRIRGRSALLSHSMIKPIVECLLSIHKVKPLFHHRRLTFLIGRSPPPYSSGSIVRKPLCRPLDLLVRGAGLCSSVTSTKSSCGGGLLTLLVVSSITTVSLRLLCLRGGLLERLLLFDRSLVLDTSITSDREWLDGGLRGERERDRRRITTSSSTTEEAGAAPPMEKQV